MSSLKFLAEALKTKFPLVSAIYALITAKSALIDSSNKKGLPLKIFLFMKIIF